MMNFWLIFITFIAVNLDFFFILLCLVNQYPLRDVIVGYVIGVAILVTASFAAGKALALFLPEWLLGFLGILPIYMALHDNDEEAGENKTTHSPVWIVLLTYLAVCSGCNLSIFLPVLTGLPLSQFGLALAFILVLTVLVVIIIKQIGRIPVITRFMNKYSELMMKVVYIGVGIYVFFDSGLISHLVRLAGLV